MILYVISRVFAVLLVGVIGIEVFYTIKNRFKKRL